MMGKTCTTYRAAFLAVGLYLGLTSSVVIGADSFVVTYRLSQQKTSHFDDARTAQTHAATVKQLGGIAKQGSHAGHYDVSYICPTWKAVALKSQEESHQWAHWLRANAFETIFVQPSENDHLESVAFRLSATKSAHFDRATEAESIADTLKMLGCEVKRGKHGGHYDVSYGCPQWRTIGLEGHEDAHQWQKWLKSKGFETKHEHNNTRTARVLGK